MRDFKQLWLLAAVFLAVAFGMQSASSIQVEDDSIDAVYRSGDARYYAVVMIPDPGVAVDEDLRDSE